MASGMAETYRWEKLCKDILIIKTLSNLCVTAFYQYILWFYKTQRESLTWKSTVSNIHEYRSRLLYAYYKSSLKLLGQPKVFSHYAVGSQCYVMDVILPIFLLKWLVVDLVDLVYLSNGNFSWVIGILPFERVNNEWFSEVHGKCDI